MFSLETQVGIRSQKNKWESMLPRSYQSWEQMPGPLLAGHTRDEPSFLNINVELSATKSVCQERPNYGYEKCQTTYYMNLGNAPFTSGHKNRKSLLLGVEIAKV
jgi:hypothetical protein